MHSRSHLKLLADGVAARFYAADCTRDMFDDNDLAHILITLANFDESFDMSMIVKLCVLAGRPRLFDARQTQTFRRSSSHTHIPDETCC